MFVWCLFDLGFRHFCNDYDMTGCCLSSQDFSLCLTQRCQKELPRPCTRDAAFVLGQLCFRFVWSGVQALLQWLWYDGLLPFQPRLQLMFDPKMPKRTPRPHTRDAAIVPGQCLFDLGLRHFCNDYDMMGCCLSSQDFSLCLTQRFQKELQGPVLGMLLLSQDNVCLMFVSKAHKRVTLSGNHTFTKV